MKIFLGQNTHSSLQVLSQSKLFSHIIYFTQYLLRSRTSLTHKFGITQLRFFPFDSGAFLSTSYDHHLKIYSTETLAVSGDFDLSSIVYTHALSPIANHLLVACATQHPTVRLVDLRSGSSTHS